MICILLQYETFILISDITDTNYARMTSSSIYMHEYFCAIGSESDSDYKFKLDSYSESDSES